MALFPHSLVRSTFLPMDFSVVAALKPKFEHPGGQYAGQSERNHPQYLFVKFAIILTLRGQLQICGPRFVLLN